MPTASYFSTWMGIPNEKCFWTCEQPDTWTHTGHPSSNSAIRLIRLPLHLNYIHLILQPPTQSPSLSPSQIIILLLLTHLSVIHPKPPPPAFKAESKNASRRLTSRVKVNLRVMKKEKSSLLAKCGRSLVIKRKRQPSASRGQFCSFAAGLKDKKNERHSFGKKMDMFLSQKASNQMESNQITSCKKCFWYHPASCEMNHKIFIRGRFYHFLCFSRS